MTGSKITILSWNWCEMRSIHEKLNGDKSLELVSGFCNFWCYLNWFISANPLQKRANPWRQNIFAYFHTSALSGSQHKTPREILVKIDTEKTVKKKKNEAKQIILRIECGGEILRSVWQLPNLSPLKHEPTLNSCHFETSFYFAFWIGMYVFFILFLYFCIFVFFEFLYFCVFVFLYFCIFLNISWESVETWLRRGKWPGEWTDIQHWQP